MIACSHGVKFFDAKGDPIECIQCDLVWEREMLQSAERRVREGRRRVKELENAHNARRNVHADGRGNR